MTNGDHRINDRFRLARLARGLSQGALADMAGVTRQSISGIESGRWSPSLEVALALAAALGTSVEALFGATPELPTLDARLAATALASARLLLSEIDGAPVAFPLVGDYGFVPGFRPALAYGDQHAGRAGRFRHRHPADRRFAPERRDRRLRPCTGPLGRAARAPPPADRVSYGGLATTPPGTGCSRPAPCTRQPSTGVPANSPAPARNTRSSASPPGAKASSSLPSTPVRCTRFQMLSSSAFVSSTASRARRPAGCSTRRSASSAHEPTALPGYGTACSAHLLVASSIAAGLGDIGVGSEPAALAYGLGFLPWQEEICELHIPRSLLGTREIHALLDVLAGSELPAQLAAIAGYDTGPCGKVSEA